MVVEIRRQRICRCYYHRRQQQQLLLLILLSSLSFFFHIHFPTFVFIFHLVKKFFLKYDNFNFNGLDYWQRYRRKFESKTITKENRRNTKKPNTNCDTFSLHFHPSSFAPFFCFALFFSFSFYPVSDGFLLLSAVQFSIVRRYV